MGFSLAYPIFLRNERGKFQLTKLKIIENNFNIQQAKREIQNGIQMVANEWIALEKQIIIQEEIVKNASSLRTAELTKFENGESSLFLINTRETYLLTNQIKLFELKSKYAKVKNTFTWTSAPAIIAP